MQTPPTQEQIVTPWVATCGTNGFEYNKLIQQFGVQPISPELLERFERLTHHKPHHWLRRNIFFAHRDLEQILNDYEQNKPIYIYTGRGPSTKSLHLGHMIPFMFTKWLQDVFGAIVVVQMSDDEKYYFKNIDFDTVYQMQYENARDIIAIGFNPDKTFIFSSHDYSTTPAARSIFHTLCKRINMNTIKDIFGFADNANMGQYIWPLHQMAPSLSKYFAPIFGTEKSIRCIIPCAIDQDPYFRCIRDVAKSFHCYKPSLILAKFLPALEGNAKMNSSNASTQQNKTIFMSDDIKTIPNTIKRYAFSGGKQTLEEHRRLGGDLGIDISYQYLRYFLSDDDELDRIAKEYSSGKMLASEIKQILSNTLVQLIQSHQLRRAEVTPDQVKYFYNMEKFCTNSNN